MNLSAPQPEVIDGSGRRKLIAKLLRSVGFDRDVDYFIDEVEYVLGRFSPDERQDYLRAERSGRGRAPAVPQRVRARILTDVIAPFEKEKTRIRRVDWNDVALAAGTVPAQGYDVVVMDETQDLSANQIRAILPHLNEDHTTTFIIDTMQRIYPQAFRWREVGLQVRPNMVYALRRNHRNTAEIARFAASIVRDLPEEEDGVPPDPRMSGGGGERPKVVAGTYRAQLDYMLKQVRPFLAFGDTVAILQPRGGGWFDFAKSELGRRRIPFCELTRSREWPTGDEQVALSTIHSAKGLEFDHVLLPGLNQEVTPHGEEEGDGTLDSLRRLLAMGAGRARKTVTVGYKPGEASTLIDLIDPSTYDLVELS